MYVACQCNIAGADGGLHDRVTGKGDFSILCSDNDVPRALDEKRIAWAAGDIVENRPPLSRGHKDWEAKFKEWVGK